MGKRAGRVVIRDVDVVDPESGTVAVGVTIVVEGGVIRAVEDGRVVIGDGDDVIEGGGLTALPGLIDCHVHVTAVVADLSELRNMSPSYAALKTAAVLRGMLRRGFTTVRDAAGADYGLAAAIDEGLVQGPRVLYGGPALSQTGGHGDIRAVGDRAPWDGFRFPSHAVICDGVAEVRRASRHVLRTGAHHIKLMVSGGVASPTDRVESTQFSADEVRAAVEEAAAVGRYVMAHAYTGEAVTRAVGQGVRSIEHGNLIDDAACEAMAAQGSYLVPTLVTYRALADEGVAQGLSATSREKVDHVLESGLRALERASRFGVKIGFGTDLLGEMHRHQAEEFAIRADVMSPLEVLRSATTTAAELVGMSDRIGRLSPGLVADIILVDRNPLEDVSVLANPRDHLKVILKGGRVVEGGVGCR